MRRRKIGGSALALVLVLGMLFGAGLTAMAAGEVTVRMDDVEVTPGQTVTAELVIEGTFAAFQGLVVYDTDALTLENIEATSALSGGITVFNQDEITGEFVDGSFVNASASNVTSDGAVLLFTFRAGSSANGTYSFSIEQFIVYDEAGEEPTVNAVDVPVAPATLYTEGQNEPSAQTAQTEASDREEDQEEAVAQADDQEEPDEDEAEEEEAAQETEEPTPTPEAEDTEEAEDDADQDDSASDDESEGNGTTILIVIVVLLVVGVVVGVVMNRARDKKK